MKRATQDVRMVTIHEIRILVILEKENEPKPMGHIEQAYQSQHGKVHKQNFRRTLETLVDSGYVEVVKLPRNKYVRTRGRPASMLVGITDSGKNYLEQCHTELRALLTP